MPTNVRRLFVVGLIAVPALLVLSAAAAYARPLRQAVIWVSIGTPGSNADVSGVVPVSGSATGSTLTRVVVSVDGGAGVVASGTKSWSTALDFSGLAAGTHQISARVYDSRNRSATALVSVNVPTSSGGTTTPTGFVKRSGTSLVVDGKPFRFTGLNIYDVNSDGSCVDRSSLSVDLDHIGSGNEVMRAWFFQPFATSSSGQRDWSAFDATLSVARQRGVKVIPGLANEWEYCDGPAKYLGWWQSGYRSTIQPGTTATYRDFVREVVTRYANDPVIAMWNLVNEGEARNADGSCSETVAASALRSFADDVGGLVKSLDPNHLVNLGTISGECGSNEGNYQYIHASPSVDVCDYHDYRFPTSPMGNTDSWNGLQTSISRCHALGKPLVVLETGIHWTRLSPATLENRAALFDQKLAAQLQAGVAGILLWTWSNTASSTWDYEIGPNDPSLALLTKY